MSVASFVFSLAQTVGAPQPTGTRVSAAGQSDPKPAAAAPADAFPVAAPESVGLDPAALERLGARVQSFVDADSIVGAELLVVKDRRTVTRRTFGLEDRDAKTPFPARGIFCVRSMTKPWCGTAIQILVDRGELALDSRIADHFHAWDHDLATKVTVAQLLTHQGGLRLSQFYSRPLSAAVDLQDVATVAGKEGPMFEPGAIFNYSDDGADTLGALVELLSDEPLDRFFDEEIAQPLGLHDTIGVLKSDDPRVARVHSAYVGGEGRWTRYWKPGQPPIFKFLLASQSLYSTCDDYARFLAMWMDGGTIGKTRILSKEAVERALTPGPQMLGYPEGFRGWRLHYGHFWMIYVDPARPQGDRVVAFGHNGSDGTFAYAIPSLDLVVLYFTQSRQQGTGPSFEQALMNELITPLLAKQRASGPAGR
jgi:CubicO group peptidase (beta-lactamase class C family)